jgi:hypothetical protein
MAAECVHSLAVEPRRVDRVGGKMASLRMRIDELTYRNFMSAHRLGTPCKTPPMRAKPSCAQMATS